MGFWDALEQMAANKSKPPCQKCLERSKRCTNIAEAFKVTIRAWEEAVRSHVKGSRQFPGKFLFSKADGSPYTNHVAINQEITAALKQAKIERHLSSHYLRHTYASLLIAAGKTPMDVSRFLGHSSSQVTEKTYVHFFEQCKQEQNTVKNDVAAYLAKVND